MEGLFGWEEIGLKISRVIQERFCSQSTVGSHLIYKSIGNAKAQAADVPLVRTFKWIYNLIL